MYNKHGAAAFVFMVLWVGQASACVPPGRPWVPSDPRDIQEFADILQADFEVYISEIQEHFRCLDAERARAMQEAAEVSQEYGRFLDESRQWRGRHN